MDAIDELRPKVNSLPVEENTVMRELQVTYAQKNEEQMSQDSENHGRTTNYDNSLDQATDDEVNDSKSSNRPSKSPNKSVMMMQKQGRVRNKYVNSYGSSVASPKADQFST